MADFLVLVYVACYIGGGALSSLNSHRLTGVCISFFILLTFYSYKKKDFVHQCKQKEASKNLRKLFDINPYPLILSRLDDGLILLTNERAQKEWPLAAEGGPQYDTRYVFRDAEDRAAVIEQLQKTSSLKNHVLQQMTAPGFTRWAIVNYETLEINHVRCILSGFTDITQLKKVEGELAKHASIDLLTGQRNSRSGMEALTQMFAESRSDWVECTLCFIDINNLKQVNDQYGHREGDALITTVCNVFAANIEPEDILFRYGGDEFIMLFFHKSNEAAEFIWAAMYKEKTSRKKQLSDNSDNAGSSPPLVH